MVDCELDLNAVLTDNSAGGSPALLFVYLFYHHPFVTSVTKTSKAGLLLFLSLGCSLGISKSETDPLRHGTRVPKFEYGELDKLTLASQRRVET